MPLTTIDESLDEHCQNLVYELAVVRAVILRTPEALDHLQELVLDRVAKQQSSNHDSFLQVQSAIP